jgi:hypothetical protein
MTKLELASDPYSRAVPTETPSQLHRRRHVCPQRRAGNPRWPIGDATVAGACGRVLTRIAGS